MVSPELTRLHSLIIPASDPLKPSGVRVQCPELGMVSPELRGQCTIQEGWNGFERGGPAAPADKLAEHLISTAKNGARIVVDKRSLWQRKALNGSRLRLLIWGVLAAFLVVA